MAKDKKAKAPPDQHADGSFLIRYPAEFRPMFEAFKEKLGQAFTVAAQRAAADYAAKHGIEPPKK